jgi:hypothetical protein
MLSLVMLIFIFAEYSNKAHYSGRYCAMLSFIILSTIMLNVIMLSVIMLNAIMLSVIMLNAIMLSVVIKLFF